MASDALPPAMRAADVTRRWARSAMRVSWRRLAIAAVLFVITDWGAQRSGPQFVPGGVLDLTAHYLTALVFLWAVPARLSEPFVAGALGASVLIDIDHVPAHLGYGFLTHGTPRPYTHSLLMILVVLAVAALWRRQASLWLGVAAGLALHFWRDVADPGTGVALLWPFTDHGQTVPRWLYLAATAACAAVVAVRLARAGQRSRSMPTEPLVQPARGG